MLEFPRWKYAVIVLVLLASTFYSLPNLYPKDPSVQVTANRGAATGVVLRQKVEAGLADAGLKPKSVEMDGDDTVMVRLASPDQQTQLQDALRDTLGQDYSVALNLLPTVPKWLDALGANPMSLGLDLQGGIHFLMQVDQQAAVQKRMDAYAENMRSLLRDARIQYRSVDVRPDHSVIVTLQAGGNADAARAALVKGLGSPAAGGPGFTWAAQGATLTARLSEADINKIAVDAVDQNRTVIAERINALGVAEPVLQRQGADRLVIQLPGLQDTAEAKRQIGATATLEFRAVTGDEATAAAAEASGQVPPDSRLYKQQSGAPILLSKRVLVSGDQLLSAVPGVDQQSGSPDVSITLNAAGGKRMLDHTMENVGKRLGIVYIERIPTVSMVDGKEVQGSRIEERVISASTIQGVFGNQFHTTGLSQDEAQSLARQLKSGALAAPMFFADQRTIGPSLGKENVERGTQAVAFAFLFTLAFFMVYYRMFGLVTCAALLMNLLMVVAVLSLFGATMTLPGFAGLALSVGMSVDANVLINERIREELRAGMPAKAAIATGYDKASGTIFDSNMTALLAGVALYAFGTGPLKGFAVTMVIGILTSVFTAVTVSRALATLIYGGRKKLKSIAI
ncbi:protein translocase subunit SecD [Lysobacter pythonis]|uniref:Protein translocase subunit SecD n=1 Tax=Solilutibacter pythonis TaxID=2483112 RepID=A0A3M2HV73_9GAMM|nr:protein translocase subunit SecD [Lysobacter pythonis]RMH93631.1 protein translocase subunit SecD [Lysobacter pythonis]